MSEKILIVTPRYWPEQVKINDICEGFAGRGYSVDVICGQPNYPAGQFYDGYHSYGHKNERHNGVHVIRHFETKRGNGSAFRVMMNYIVSSFAANRAVRRVRKQKYEAVLIYQTSPVMTCTAGLRIARRQNIPAVIYAVDIWPDSLYRELDMRSPLLRAIFRRISASKYRAASRIVTQNKTAKQYFAGELSIHPGKVECIPPGPCGYAGIGSPDDVIRERYLGSFNIVIHDDMLERLDRKTLISCAEHIRDTGLYSIRLIVICVADAAELKSQISRKRLGDIVFVENVKDTAGAAGYYAVADAFLSCEKTTAGDQYSFPDDIINYMSAGRPVIFAGDGEGRRIIREAGCGRVLDPEDGESLFRTVMEMYRMPRQELDLMGQAALRFLQQHYSMDACVDGLLNVMNRSRASSEEEFVISSNINVIRAETEEDDPNE